MRAATREPELFYVGELVVVQAERFEVRTAVLEPAGDEKAALGGPCGADVLPWAAVGAFRRVTSGGGRRGKGSSTPRDGAELGVRAAARRARRRGPRGRGRARRVPARCLDRRCVPSGPRLPRELEPSSVPRFGQHSSSGATRLVVVASASPTASAPSWTSEPFGTSTARRFVRTWLP